MKTIKLTAITATIAFSLLLNVPRASAQDDPVPPPPAPAAPGATPDANRMEQFRQRMIERLKTALKASDDEWSVIQPLLEKVQTKQREAMGGRFGGGRRGGPGGQDGGDRNSHQNWGGGSPESDALRKVLEVETTPAADIKAKLESLREARKKSAAELDQAREELRKVLTQRQEAALVLMGFLQ